MTTPPTNLASGTLTGAIWIVGANSSMSIGANITTDSANIILNGPGASFTSLSPLAEIASVGRLEVTGGGSFTTAGNLDNAGSIDLASGTLNVTGNYTQEASGAFEVAIGGLAAGSQFGQLNVTGLATLNGALSVSLIGDYTPPSGDSYRVLTFGSRSGDFSAEFGLYFEGGEGFVPTYDSAGLDLVLTSEEAGSMTSVASSPNPSDYGQSVTFTATVASTLPTNLPLTGSVTFYDGTTELGSAPVNQGEATYTVSTLAAGSHAIIAEYSGDSNFSGSNSNALPDTVDQDGSTTAVTPSVNPTDYGQSVTFTATVASAVSGFGTPTGSVTFYDGTTALNTETLVDGSASLTTSSLGVNANSITAQYDGDTNFTGSTSTAFTQTVNPDGTATGLTTSVNPSVYGQSVTFTATVSAAAPGSGTPAGQVVFYDGTTAIDTANLGGGTASFTTSTLALDGHSITAEYQGNSDYTASPSSAVTQTVEQDGSQTTLSTSANPAVLGQPVTFTATVSAAAPGSGTPTGQVTFYDGTTAIDTETLVGGSAAYTTSSLTLGIYPISVAYGGDPDFIGSTSATINEAVKQESAAAAVTSSVNPTVYGQSVTFTATISATPPATGTPTGQVTFYDGTTAIDTETLVDGTAAYTTSALAVGGHAITVQYAGDSNFFGSTSTAFTQTVDQDASTTAVSSSANPSVYGQSVTFTAAVSADAPGAGTPSGTVTFYDGTTAIDSETLSGGTASYTTSALSLDGHSITAQYAGNTDFTGSTSTAVAQTVNQDGSTTNLLSSANPAVLGQSITFTAVVNAEAPGSETPTGQVTFYDGTTAIDTETLSGGSASYTIAGLALGTYPVSVAYGGDSDFIGSTSATTMQAVRQESATAVVTSSINPADYGQSVTFTATVTATPPGTGTPTGQVTFYDGTTAIDTETLVDGSASYATSSLAGGGHAITVQYSGDSDFMGSTSPVLIQTVNPDGTATGLTSSLNPATYEQSVTFTATVTAEAPGSGTPAGTVTFYDGTTAIDTANLSGGTASYTTSTLSVGGHTITAQYNATADFAASTSTALDQTINPLPPATLEGEVYNDPDGNGTLVAGAGLSGWTVDLESGSARVASTTTESNGDYTFTNVLPGSYTIVVVEDPGYVATVPASGSFAVTAPSGQTVGNLNVGEFQTVTLGGEVYDDVNDNGTLDPGETGLAGWTVNLRNGSDQVVQTQTTDVDGDYSFTGVGPGQFTIAEVLQPGYVQTQPASGPIAITTVGGMNLGGEDVGIVQGPVLSVTDLATTPSSGLVSGASRTISWDDTNNGGIPVTASFDDYVTITNTSTGQVLGTAEVPYNFTTRGPLGVGASAPQQYAFSLPNGSAGVGDIQFTVTADVNDSVSNGLNASGRMTSITESSTLAPSPDLVVQDIVVNGNNSPVIPGHSIPVTWTDFNQGNAAAVGSWIDQVFLASDPAGTQDLQLVQTVEVPPLNDTTPADLAISGGLAQSTTITIPAVDVGDKYVVVETGLSESFFEFDTSNDTTVSSSPITIPPSVQVSLASPGNSTFNKNAANPASSATVTRNDTNVGSLSVTITSSNPSAVLLAANPGATPSASISVVIPDGAYSAVFYVDAVQDNLVDGTQTSSLNPSASSYLSIPATATELETNTPTLSLTLASNTFADNGGTTATLTRNTNNSSPNDTALTVAIASSNPSVATAPATVTIPAGQNSVSFPIAGVATGLLVDSRSVTFTTNTPLDPVTGMNFAASGATTTVTDTNIPVLELSTVPDVEEDATDSGDRHPDLDRRPRQPDAARQFDHRCSEQQRPVRLDRARHLADLRRDDLGADPTDRHRQPQQRQPRGDADRLRPRRDHQQPDRHRPCEHDPERAQHLRALAVDHRPELHRRRRRPGHGVGIARQYAFGLRHHGNARRA